MRDLPSQANRDKIKRVVVVGPAVHTSVYDRLQRQSNGFSHHMTGYGCVKSIKPEELSSPLNIFNTACKYLRALSLTAWEGVPAEPSGMELCSMRSIAEQMSE